MAKVLGPFIRQQRDEMAGVKISIDFCNVIGGKVYDV